MGISREYQIVRTIFARSLAFGEIDAVDLWLGVLPSVVCVRDNLIADLWFTFGQTVEFKKPL